MQKNIVLQGLINYNGNKINSILWATKKTPYGALCLTHCEFAGAMISLKAYLNL